MANRRRDAYYVRPRLLGGMLLFGSPLVAVCLFSVVTILYAVAPRAFFPLSYLLAWAGCGAFAAVGSAAGAALIADRPERREVWSAHDVKVVAAFFASAALYTLLSAIPYFLLGLYVMTFRFV